MRRVGRIEQDRRLYMNSQEPADEQWQADEIEESKSEEEEQKQALPVGPLRTHSEEFSRKRAIKAAQADAEAKTRPLQVEDIIVIKEEWGDDPDAAAKKQNRPVWLGRVLRIDQKPRNRIAWITYQHMCPKDGKWENSYVEEVDKRTRQPSVSWVEWSKVWHHFPKFHPTPTGHMMIPARDKDRIRQLLTNPSLVRERTYEELSTGEAVAVERARRQQQPEEQRDTDEELGDEDGEANADACDGHSRRWQTLRKARVHLKKQRQT
jgi:hypothetical protein